MDPAGWIPLDGSRRLDPVGWIPPAGSRWMDPAGWILLDGSRRLIPLDGSRRLIPLDGSRWLDPVGWIPLADPGSYQTMLPFVARLVSSLTITSEQCSTLVWWSRNGQDGQKASSFLERSILPVSPQTVIRQSSDRHQAVITVTRQSPNR